jgi:hypothetical protein
MSTQLQLHLHFDDSFCQYHSENPQIYAEFEKTALKAVKYRSRFGAKAIFEIIRWNTMVSGNDGFKVNNNYTSFYARLFELKHPQHAGLFSKRKSKFDNL